MDDENKRKFDELKEILFWQQLNKQLIALRTQGMDIKEEHHSFLQKISFDDNLFAKITGASLLDEVPLALITDFSGICFLNLKLETWNVCLTQVISNTLALDVEQALADAFVAAEKYDRRFPSEDGGNEDDDDPELYEFIDQYLGVREKQGRNIADIITRLYQLKAESLQSIIELPGYKSFLTRRENQLFFDLTKYDGKGEALTAYFENFCERADSLISRVKSFTEMNLYGLLHRKADENNLKPSIREFINHEIPIVRKESQLMDTFIGSVGRRRNQLNLYEIPICSLSPFFFLENPFPVV